MNPGPPKNFEALVAVVTPPACREEVLGDLHERYRSPFQYVLEAALTVPSVIVSRIRRSADPPALVIQAFVLYASFLAGAWLNGGALLRDEWGLLRLATPAAMALLGPILDDAYTKPGRRSRFYLARGPLLGTLLALASQGIFWMSSPHLAVPRWIFLSGCATGWLLSSAARIWLPPARKIQEVRAPARSIHQPGGSSRIPRGVVELLRLAAILIVMVTASIWLAGFAGLPAPRVLAFLSIPWIIYEVWTASDAGA